jgi:alpha-L-fucosidase 2
MNTGKMFVLAAGSFCLLSSIALRAAPQTFDHPGELKTFDVQWSSPGQTSKDSMPLGNGDIGLNVWADEAGNVSFYISKTDAWDENGRLLKLGKVRLNFQPNPFRRGEAFRQALVLRGAAVEIEAGTGEAETRIRIWVDAHHPAVRCEARVPDGMTIAASLEPWRLKPETLDDELVSGLNYFPELFGKTVVRPDVIVDEASDRVVWYHENPETPSFLKNLTLQGLEKFPLPNPLAGRIFGGLMEGAGFARRTSTTLVSAAGRTRKLSVHLLTRHPATPRTWRTEVDGLARRTDAVPFEEARKAHAAWWERFWDRSWIYVRGGGSVETNDGPESEGRVVTRGYILQRFINACAGRGGFPIKFNGSIFAVEEEGTEGFADYRRWGPGYWWQNTRLPYMAMPAAGDFDLMNPFFEMYAGLLPLGRYRTKLYFGHDGVYFPECLYFWGAVFTETWGDKPLSERPERIQASGYHKYEWVGGLEMAARMIEYYLYTEDRDFLRGTALPFAEAVLTFFEQHYKTGADGRLVLFPSQALETWWDCTNPMPEVAGLHDVTKKLGALPPGLLTRKQKDLARRLAAKLPPIPTREVDGVRMLAPAERFADKRNVENPELYAVWPFTLYGTGKPGLELAVAALNHRQDKGHFGWRQDDLFMALLGLTDQARAGLAERARQWDKNRRFPAFWGPNYDWTPDQDHGGVLTKTLQTMLLQCDGREIRLTPAWPEDWDADFRLHAPFRTVIEGRIRGGKVVALDVSPRSRQKDIVR